MQSTGLNKQAALTAAGETIRCLVAENRELWEKTQGYARVQKIASIASMAEDRGLIDSDSRSDFVEDLESRDERGLDIAAEGIRYAAGAPNLGTIEKRGGASGGAGNLLDSYLDQRAAGHDFGD